MACEKGIPAFFTTFTAAEGLWTDLQSACGNAFWGDLTKVFAKWL